MVTSMGDDVMMMFIFSFSIIHISFRLCPLARKRSKQNLFANFASQLREILGLSRISVELINSIVTLRFDNGRHRLSYDFLRKPVPLEKGELICIMSTSLMYSLSYNPSIYHLFASIWLCLVIRSRIMAGDRRLIQLFFSLIPAASFCRRPTLILVYAGWVMTRR